MLEPDREENTQLRKASLLSNSPFRCDAKPPSFGACATSSEHSVLSKSALCWAPGPLRSLFRGPTRQSGRQSGRQTGGQTEARRPLDWRQFCVTGFRGPGIVRGQSGRQTGGQTGRQCRPGGPDGDNSALQDCGAPGLSEDNLGDKLADMEARIGDNSALQDSGAPGLSEDTNWRTN